MRLTETIPSEGEILDRLRQGMIGFPPLTVRLDEPASAQARRVGQDAVLDIGWAGRTYRFLVEIRSLSTPKSFETALARLLRPRASNASEYEAHVKPDTVLLREACLEAREVSANPSGDPRADLRPMLVLPYLPEERLHELEAIGVSGIDLCGNGVVTVPGELFVFRSGAPNRFPASARVKNIYRKSSAIVARSFLLRPLYPSVRELEEEVWRRGGRSSQSTVSKVLKALEDDLIVTRRPGEIQLAQPEKLLDRLAQNYEPPTISRRYRAHVPLDPDAIVSALSSAASRVGCPLALTGTGSVSRYAVMATSDLLSFYCPKADPLLTSLGPYNSADRFPNLEILETEDDRVYFDVRPDSGWPWASPLQVYFELLQGDLRDRETAFQVKTLLFREMPNRNDGSREAPSAATNEIRGPELHEHEPHEHANRGH